MLGQVVHYIGLFRIKKLDFLDIHADKKTGDKMRKLMKNNSGKKNMGKRKFHKNQ